MTDLDFKKMVLYEKESLLLFRRTIMKLDLSQIVDSIKDCDWYLNFLDAVSYVLSKDSDFFYLKDYIEKTQNIINNLSYQFNTKGEVRDVENSIKKELNVLAGISDSKKEEIIEGYLDDEYYYREELPYTEDLIYESMANDFVVFKLLSKEANGEDELKNVNCSQFIQSTSFFTGAIPEFYELNPNIYKVSKNYLDKLKKENKNYKKYIKRAQKKLDEFKS